MHTTRQTIESRVRFIYADCTDVAYIKRTILIAILIASMLRDLNPGAPAVELGIPVTCLAGRWLEGSEEFSGAGMAARFLVGQGYKQVCGSATAWGDGRERIPIVRCSRFNVHCTACSFEVTGWFGVQVPGTRASCFLDERKLSLFLFLQHHNIKVQGLGV